MATGIDYLDESWSPVTGCSPVSRGCANCWAKRDANRMRGRFGYPEDDPFAVTLRPERLEQPLRWRKPRRVGVSFMGDLFHKDVPDEFIDRVFAVMALASWHTFLLLTKRPERMADWFASDTAFKVASMGGMPEREDRMRRCQVVGMRLRTLRPMPTMELHERRGKVGCDLQFHQSPWPLPNVWLGVSVEDQASTDARIPKLMKIPAAVRFISAEPLLGPIELDWTAGGQVLGPCDECGERGINPECEACDGMGSVNWTVAGCESGPGRRPAELGWFRQIRDVCQENGVPLWIKQLPVDGKVSHDPAEWPEDLRVREFPKC